MARNDGPATPTGSPWRPPRRFATKALGLVGKTDLLLLNVLVRPGDESFGFQLLRMPIYALLAYRVSLQL